MCGAHQAALLRKVDLFAGLSPAQLETLAASLSSADYPPGATVVAKGDPGEHFFMIRSGTVRVFYPDAPSPANSIPGLEPGATSLTSSLASSLSVSSSSGDAAAAPGDSLLARLGPGMWFGERALLAASDAGPPERRAATVVAEPPGGAQLAVLSRSAFCAALALVEETFRVAGLRKAEELAPLLPAQLVLAAAAFERQARDRRAVVFVLVF